MNKLFFPTTDNNHIEFWKDGPSYEERYLHEIQKAKHCIYLQTYILNYDDVGRRICDALIAAQKRGVEIFILIDSIGSHLFPLSIENQLRESGIQFYRFNKIKLKWFYRWGRRLHHKILAIDYQCCFVGGINIQSAFDIPHLFPRLDFAVFLNGPAAIQVTQYCQLILKKSIQKNFSFKNIDSFKHPHLSSGNIVSISVNDWALGFREISKLYSQIATESKEEVTIISSYFFPRRKFMRQLVQAKKRGVRIRLILPSFSDWPSYILASEFLYQYFLKHQVEIYLWKKSILHGKMATVDGHWTIIGSFNLDYTSYQQNLEMNVNIQSESFTQNVNDQIEELIISGCEKIDTKQFSFDTSYFLTAKRFFFYLLLSLVANFSIGLTFPYQERSKNKVMQIIKVLISISLILIGLLGLILPFFPGIPFLVAGLMMMYSQIKINRKTN